MENTKMMRVRTQAFLKEIVSNENIDVAIEMLLEYDREMVQKGLAYGAYFYDGYKQDFPNGTESPVMSHGKDRREELISHKINKISIDNSCGDAIVKMELDVFNNTKAGVEIINILSGKNKDKEARLVSNIQTITGDNTMSLRVVSFNFVTFDRKEEKNDA